MTTHLTHSCRRSHRRLTDYHGIHVEQESLDFAIPLFEEDVPLYLDPFLLWSSPSQQDQSLHTSLINAFNHLGELMRTGDERKAIEILIVASECDEVGLGSSKKWVHGFVTIQSVF